MNVKGFKPGVSRLQSRGFKASKLGFQGFKAGVSRLQSPDVKVFMPNKKTKGDMKKNEEMFGNRGKILYLCTRINRDNEKKDRQQQRNENDR